MIRENLARVREEIRRAAEGCGRDPADIKLVAVSKKKSVAEIKEAVQCGQITFGENYIQEAVAKIDQLDPQLQWHFIGHLQSNKARNAARCFHLVETVDRIKIARALDRHAAELDRILNILVQVNIGREPQKSGVAPEKTEELLRQITTLPNLRLLGLMATPPYSRDAEASRPWFRALKNLGDQLKPLDLFADPAKVELSMGMSGDFQVAIEEGATMVRVGTAIFGPRIQ